MNRSVLIVGAEGLLGGALLAHARALDAPCRATGLKPASDKDPASTAHLDLADIPPDWRPPSDCGAAIVCAAITRLESCRADPAGSRFINVVQTLELTRRLIDAGVFVVFPSSNLVFDGRHPQVASDAPTHPQTEYGRHKAETEAGLRQWSDRTAVVRLTKVLHGRWPLLASWIDALRSGQPIRPFADLRCAPIPLDRVVSGLWRIAQERRAGTWQFSAPDDVSYADLARHLAERMAVPRALVQPVYVGDQGGLEHRPEHTTLDTTRARAELGMQFPTALDALDQVLEVSR